ncbi:hypothetical protein AXG93_523s1170 [Marchantia polymorpha subsp. ruderalis]|uniref:Uncharacterized protein n=1 Tax=Marchantia polymorpha subsp. ruderalis TaxID=1480154 RepID=A0A176VXL8_MARPO|nr:hypothetical protein AXG93_523s1170 [Marchantia polymorpha subsp. ruderalis]
MLEVHGSRDEDRRRAASDMHYAVVPGEAFTEAYSLKCDDQKGEDPPNSEEMGSELGRLMSQMLGQAYVNCRELFGDKLEKYSIYSFLN